MNRTKKFLRSISLSLGRAKDRTKSIFSFKRRQHHKEKSHSAERPHAERSKKRERNISGLWWYRLFAPRLSLREQTFFAKRLAFLINAGIPVVDSLHMLRDQTRRHSHKRVFDQIVKDAEAGQALSRSFGKFPNIFGQFAIHIIRVGESSGTLSQNLEYLADELKKKHELRRKVVGAFVYPIFITIATVGITGLLTVFIFPKIMPIFQSLNVTLPLSTRIVIAISEYLRSYGLLTLGLLVLAIIVFVFLVKRSRIIHIAFDRFVLRLPLIGVMIKYYNVANASRTLGLLLKSGSRLSEALLITADTTPNLVYKKEFAALSNAVDRGERVSVRLHAKRDYFPDILAQMVAVGERSGTLSDTLVYLSELYEAEVDDFTKNLSSMIEPVLMIAMGIIVGFVAISVITPIYGITQHLTPR